MTDSIYNHHGSVLPKKIIETEVMSIEIDLTNGQTLRLAGGSSKLINISYSPFTNKQVFIAYTEDNRLWAVAERRRLTRMLIVKDATIVHKTIKN